MSPHLLRLRCLAFLLAAASATTARAQSLENLRATFADPPAAARPMVRWWWFGAAVNKPEILRELQQMKADGIGGAELAFVYPMTLDDPAKGVRNLPFLSPEMLDCVRYAQAEGRKLGLRIDVTLGSGWPYGGPHIPLQLAATRLLTRVVPIAPDATSVLLPKLGEGESLIAAFYGSASDQKSAGERMVRLQIPPGATSIPIELGSHGMVVEFFIAGHTRQQVKRAAVGAEGFVLDPFSHEAVATHLKAVGEPLLSAFGSMPPYAVFSDSLEAYGADWTPNLPEEFARRRGYDLLPHLPEFVAGGTPQADKVRHDYGVTLTELINENYLAQINSWAKQHGTRFRSQTYGEPAVSFSSQRLVTLPEGEGPQWRAFSTLRWATSANHVFGNNVSSGETFTWLHSPVFRATPLDMKAEADIDFLMGENLLIFHGWPYSPPASELPKNDPGWSLYAAAVFNNHNPWHPVMPAVTQYISRISAMLREGQPANQIALLLPTDDAWTSFSPGKVTVTGAMNTLIPRELMSAILSAGYNVDFIDADAINSVGLGTHQIVVLPPTDRIPVVTLHKLNDWAAHGGKLISVGRLPSLDAEGAPLANAAQLTRGITLVPGSAELGDALHKAAKPDFEIVPDDITPDIYRTNVGFIRRKLPHADIYFVANTANRPVRVSARFATTHPFGEQIDPDSGATYATERTGGYQADIQLAPYESRLFIFTDTDPHAPLFRLPSVKATDISEDWRLTFTDLHKTVDEPKLTDWTTSPDTLHYSGETVYARDISITASEISNGKRIFLAIDGGKPLPGDPNTPLAIDDRHIVGPDGLPNPLVTKPGPGMHAYYDPPLHEAALVTVNGKSAGALWHPPYRLDITPLLHAGTNTIALHVYNTALNAWSANPPRDYSALKAKYGDRFQMQDMDKIKPVPSGITGAIHLIEESQ